MEASQMLHNSGGRDSGRLEKVGLQVEAPPERNQTFVLLELERDVVPCGSVTPGVRKLSIHAESVVGAKVCLTHTHTFPC